MDGIAHIEVHPLLVATPVNARTRVGLVSLTVVPPNHASVRFTSITSEPNGWVLPTLRVSCDDGQWLKPAGGGGGGADGWMRWDADFLGHVPDSVGVVNISFVERHSATEVTAVSVAPQMPGHADVADRDPDDTESVLAKDHGRLLPTSVAPVRSMVEGVDNHVVVSVERWTNTSVVLVYTPDERKQIALQGLLPPVAVGRDGMGRTYDVRSEGGGTWCGGAASYLRVTPRLPSDADALRVDRAGESGGSTPVTFPLR